MSGGKNLITQAQAFIFFFNYSLKNKVCWFMRISAYTDLLLFLYVCRFLLLFVIHFFINLFVHLKMWALELLWGDCSRGRARLSWSDLSNSLFFICFHIWIIFYISIARDVELDQVGQTCDWLIFVHLLISIFVLYIQNFIISIVFHPAFISH